MPELRVVTQNIWGINEHWQERADAIGRNMVDLEVDIVCIQESAPDHFEVLKSQSFSSFPHASYAPGDDGSVTPMPLGLAMISRLPLLDTGKVDIGRERERSNPWMRILQYMTVATPSGHPLTVFNTHLFLSSGQKASGIRACLDFMQRDSLDRVVSVSQVNTEAIVDGSLLLSDHIGVMATIAQ
ncbi:MAG: hypothetical protein OXF63_13970 [Anaerolineaceae bacterium]|nr:hypothetical protein [Anaerolineaceae bacterium]